jgi:uncharacterized protein (TIGR02453 family)
MTDASYFSPELFAFLRQLKRHNNREWFAANKHRYEQFVRDPSLRFISSFAPELYRISAHFVADARPTRGSLFRIYRDTRFSGDKRPYKTHVGIHFSHRAGKDAHAPVFYLHLEPDGCFSGGGIWHPDHRALAKIRSAIVAQPQAWRKARGRLELDGESLTRPPRGYDANHPLLEDIKRKDFISSIAFSEEEVCASGFMRQFVACCRKMAPLVQFTTEALGLKY